MDGQTNVVLVPENQFWVLAIGMIVPLATYALNKLFPGWRKLPEWIKGLGQVIVTAVVGGLFSALVNDVKGADAIAQHCISAVIASLYAHNYLWKPANVNVKLGARPTPTQTPKTPEEAPEAAVVQPERLVPGVAPATTAREIA